MVFLNWRCLLALHIGSKITHFKKLHEKTGIPYAEMVLFLCNAFRALSVDVSIPPQLFFDDEGRNREVESLGESAQTVFIGITIDLQVSFTGVTFCLVRDGTTARIFEKGLADWRKRHPEEVMGDAA
jgi:magnesium-dependent phosphatase 1